MNVNTVREFLSNPYLIWCGLARHNLLSWMKDETYLKILYRLKMGKKLNMVSPSTFNEKMQWLKLHDRNPLYTTMVDKYEVKQYVADIIGEQYIIPTLGVWDHFDDIDFNLLPNQFVLKCTHDSGGLVICKDKSKLDMKQTKTILEKCLTKNYYLQNREWPYKNVKPRIIAEKYMTDESGEGLKDYKFFCFGGEAKCFKVDFDRFIEHHANYYDMKKHQLDFGEAAYPPVYGKDVEIPSNYEFMGILAEKLSDGIPFLRADFYNVGGQVYFGELTFYPASGMGAFTSDEWDLKLGEWLKLPRGGYCLITEKIIAIVKTAEKDNEQFVHNELGYKNTKKSTSELRDYKIWCFNGKPKLTLVCTERYSSDGLHEDFFDTNWNHLSIKRPRHPFSASTIMPPVRYDEMLDLAGKLAYNIPFVRVDFYEVQGQIYFGEITFYPASGIEEFEPRDWDKKLGDWIDI